MVIPRPATGSGTRRPVQFRNVGCNPPVGAKLSLVRERLSSRSPLLKATFTRKIDSGTPSVLPEGKCAANMLELSSSR